ncbi:C40 family peptidase [Ornithinimicrobium sp. Arc0846-15]|nr:C40 family peptidase [Ornithinimicrobium laminariae]
MTVMTKPGRHRAPRGARSPQLVRAGATAAAVAGIAAAGVAPASANAGAGGGGDAAGSYSNSSYDNSGYDSGRQGAPDRSDWRGDEDSATTAETNSSSYTATQANLAAPTGSSSIMDAAAKYTGVPYLWGGETTAGFDCSGYTQTVFAEAGINIPRTARAQQAAATPVSEPAVGDLIFWGSPAWHVGIYAGDGMMYDAATPGTVSDLRPIFSGVTGYGRIG